MARRATNYTMEDLLAYKAYIAASEGSEKRGAQEIESPIGKETHLRLHIFNLSLHIFECVV